MNYNIIVQLLVHQLVLKKQAVTNIFFAKDIASVGRSHKKKKNTVYHFFLVSRVILLELMSCQFIREKIDSEQCSCTFSQARFKHRATAVPNEFKNSTLARFFIFLSCFRQQPFYSTELNLTSETKSCQRRAAVELQSSQLSTAVARRLKQALIQNDLKETIVFVVCNLIY